MKAVPVETINRIIDSIKNELAIELLKAVIENHAVDISSKEINVKFIELVGRIRAIDSGAADWIMDNQLILDKESNTLCDLFNWDKSKQGHLYWNEISNRLGE